MTHASGCFRSDGDWFCAHGCTHERDQEHAALVAEVRRLRHGYEGIDAAYSKQAQRLAAAERERDEARAIIPAAKALVEYLDDDGMCRVCGETLDQCHEECEARVLRAALAKPDGGER